MVVLALPLECQLMAIRLARGQTPAVSAQPVFSPPQALVALSLAASVAKV